MIDCKAIIEACDTGKFTIDDKVQIYDLVEKVEKGLLVEKPCNIDDVLFTTNNSMSPKTPVVAIIVTKISCDQKSVTTCDLHGKEYTFNFSDFGKAVFVDNKQAEIWLNKAVKREK